MNCKLQIAKCKFQIGRTDRAVAHTSQCRAFDPAICNSPHERPDSSGDSWEENARQTSQSRQQHVALPFISIRRKRQGLRMLRKSLFVGLPTTVGRFLAMPDAAILTRTRPHRV
jgi:hypothetical protein